MLKFLTAVLILLVWSPLHAEGQAKEQGGPIPFRKLDGWLDQPHEIASWRAGCLAKENCEGDAYQLLDGGVPRDLRHRERPAYRGGASASHAVLRVDTFGRTLATSLVATATTQPPYSSLEEYGGWFVIDYLQ